MNDGVAAATLGEVVQEAVVACPHPRLRPYLHSYNGYRHEGLPAGVHVGLPGRSLTIIVAFGEPLSMSWHDGHQKRIDHLWALASGLHDAPVAIHHDGFQYGVQLDLTPTGCRALLGLALAHDSVDLRTVLGPSGHELVDRLSSASGWEARFRTLDDVLLRAISDHAPRPELSQAWAVIESSGGVISIGALAEDLGWSRRHLLNQFRGEFGLTPKTAAQIVRFERANRRLRRNHSEDTLARVAAEVGYADQAHLSRDFIRFAGAPPSLWRRDPLLFPIVQDSPAEHE